MNDSLNPTTNEAGVEANLLTLLSLAVGAIVAIVGVLFRLLLEEAGPLRSDLWRTAATTTTARPDARKVGQHRRQLSVPSVFG
jgi:hypothetical protein